MQRCVNVIGVGMSPFSTVAVGPSPSDLAVGIVRQALADAGLGTGDIVTLFVASGLSDNGSLQRALERAGLSHLSIRTLQGEEGSSGLLYEACHAIRQGQVECALVLGLQAAPVPLSQLMPSLEHLGAAAYEYMSRFQFRRETLAMLAIKARRHAAHNPLAAFRDPLTLDDVLDANPIVDYLTQPQLAWPTAGVAAIVLCCAEYARRHHTAPAVSIIAQAHVSPTLLVGQNLGPFAAVGYDVSVAAARDLYEQAGMGPEEVGVCELHDSSTLSELLLYEALGLCPEGSAEKLVEDGDNTDGGNLVVNPSGGLLSLGQAAEASSLAQSIELVHHLRGSAGARQVAGARIALQHQISADGTVTLSLYRRD